MYYEEYHRELFPRVAYTKLDMACVTAQWGERYPSVQVWLKKVGAKDYRYQTRIDSDDFLKFPVPDSFFKKILGWIKTVAQHNQTLIDKTKKRERTKSRAAKRSTDRSARNRQESDTTNHSVIRRRPPWQLLKTTRN